MPSCSYFQSSSQWLITHSNKVISSYPHLYLLKHRFKEEVTVAHMKKEGAAHFHMGLFLFSDRKHISIKVSSLIKAFINYLMCFVYGTL